MTYSLRDTGTKFWCWSQFWNWVRLLFICVVTLNCFINGSVLQIVMDWSAPGRHSPKCTGWFSLRVYYFTKSSGSFPWLSCLQYSWLVCRFIQTVSIFQNCRTSKRLCLWIQNFCMYNTLLLTSERFVSSQIYVAFFSHNSRGNNYFASLMDTTSLICYVLGYVLNFFFRSWSISYDVVKDT